MPLIPVEEFLERHPENNDDDEKTLMSARINYELSEREVLEQERQELLKQKAALMADNKKRKEDLENLDKDLEKFIDVSISMKPNSHLSIIRFRLHTLYRKVWIKITSSPGGIRCLHRIKRSGCNMYTQYEFMIPHHQYTLATIQYLRPHRSHHRSTLDMFSKKI